MDSSTQLAKHWQKGKPPSKIQQLIWRYIASGKLNFLFPFIVSRTVLNKYGNSLHERILAMAIAAIAEFIWAALLIATPILVCFLGLITLHYLHLPFPSIDIDIFAKLGLILLTALRIFDTFIMPWLSKRVLGLEVLRIYPASRWAVRLIVSLLLTKPCQRQILFPKCVFWEVHTSYKSRKPSNKLAFARSALRDIRKLTDQFSGQYCFLGHTPMQIERFIVLSGLGSIVNLQGPFLSITPVSRTFKVTDKSAPWHIYLISTQTGPLKNSSL